MAEPDRARTYVMAYWPIPSNAKRSLDHYSKHLPLSLEMLAGQNLFFVSGSDDVLTAVQHLCIQNNIRLHMERIAVVDLRKWSAMDNLLVCARKFGSTLKEPPADFRRDKGLIHYWRDLRQAGDEAFRKIFCIWHSKIDLLHAASRANPFSSREFAWVDASISRFSGRRPGWDFRQLSVSRECVVHHYPNDMCKGGRQLALNASFLLGDAAVINRLYAAYEDAFALCLREDYPNDEETVLDTIVSRMPELFSVISGRSVP
jgi:hypothetical protein